MNPRTLFAIGLLGIAMSAAAAPHVVVTKTPPLISYTTADAPGESSLTLTNVGDQATTVSLISSGGVFTHNISSFTLGVGASHQVGVRAVVGLSDDSGLPKLYEGASLPSGAGVPSGLSIPVRILVRSSTGLPGEPVFASEKPRIEVSGPAGVNPTGVVRFFSDFGSSRVFAVSDAPWLIPDKGQQDVISNGVADVAFTVDRSQRPDVSKLEGSVAGTINLYFGSGETVKSQSVTVVDTIVPEVRGAQLPSLGSDSPRFVPGVGNVTGGGGKVFLSDFSILNESETSSANDVKLFYTSAAGSTLETTISSIAPRSSLALADVVGSVFGQSQQVGVLQVRADSIGQLSFNANVFNVTNPAGTYGTALPTLRVENAAGPGETIEITGLTKSNGTHTNLYLQEMSGTLTTLDIQVFDVNGAVAASRSGVQVAPFNVASIVDVAPTGGVFVRITIVDGGRISAYATPVDDVSGDTWTVLDWGRDLGFNPAQVTVVPITGSAPGANNTYFRTDIWITNVSGFRATARLQYVLPDRSVVDIPVDLSPLQTRFIPDVVATFFGMPPPSLGQMLVVPRGGGKFVTTARTYTTISGEPGTFGTSVPTVSLNGGLAFGQTKFYGGIEDSTLTTLTAAKPGTLRTNFGWVETAGRGVTVRATIYYSNGTQFGLGEADGSATFEGPPNGLVLVTGLLRSILGDSREAAFGDLRNLIVKFEVIEGGGKIVPFITTTDNGTGDTILRLE